MSGGMSEGRNEEVCVDGQSTCGSKDCRAQTPVVCEAVSFYLLPV